MNAVPPSAIPLSQVPQPATPLAAAALSNGNIRALPARWQAEELNLIRQITRLLGRSLEPDIAIRQMLQLMSEWLGLNRGRVLLADASGKSVQVRHAYGLTREEIERGRFKRNEGLTGRVFATGQLCVIQDIDQEPEYLGRTVRRSDLPDETVAFIALPIQQEQRTIGVLAVHRLRSRQRALNDDLEMLRIVATLISQVLALQAEVARRTADLRHENQTLRQQLRRYDGQHGIIGHSPAVRTCLNQVERLGPTDITVLILGESGTGKELFARALHDGSARKQSPFIKVNCAAIPDTLFESEMFGHEKGAFTGALSQQTGHFEQAQGGTLFLDEVGEIPLSQQSKLLRVLQDRTLYRVGGKKEIPLDIRVIAATNRNLADEVAAGRFRADLYYRLSVVAMKLPPLRERDGDVPMLLAHYLHQACLTYRRNVRLDADALTLLAAHPWPGNIRELQNTVTRMVLMSPGDEIGHDQVREYLHAESGGSASMGMGAGIVKAHANSAGREAPQNCAPSDEDDASARPYQRADSHSRETLMQALLNSKGNKSAAARALGMSRRQLLYRMDVLGMA